MKNTFLLLFAACVSQVLSLDERGCKGLMELIITIDGSDSINEPDYISLRESMARLVQSLDIRESEIRLSFVVFSSGIAFRRNLTGDKNQLLIDAQNLPHPRDGTKTFEAIEVMRNIASKRRKGVPVIGLVLTDGISKNITKTTQEAFLIKQENVTMYAIGISRIKNFTELRNIASARDKVLYYKSFQELAEKLSSLVKLVCPKCPPNPLLRNSVTVQGSYIVEDTLSYHCKPDFVAVGNNTITCQRDQTWTKLDYACLAQCGPPPVIDKTELVLPGNLEGSKTKYKCSKNTVLKGTPETECKEDGTWSEPVFECIPDCGLPGIIPRATLSHGSTLEGTIRTYTCAYNTVAQGDPDIVCQKNGQWSKTKVYCRPDCGNPKTIIRAFLNPGGTLEGDTRTYTCNQGTKTEGKTSITCGPDGKWSYTNLYCRPDCGEPMAIDRAELVRFQIIEGVKHLLDTLEGTRREYRCRENTVQEGDNKILCSSKGIWIRDGPPLYCRPDCGNPPVIKRSKVTYTGTLEKQIATYTCDRNTVTEGETQIVCQQDGYWSATSLYCRPDCGEPKIIERATISKGNNLEGTRRRYTCNPKTVSEGITEILCGKNGRWSDIDLFCRPDCGIPYLIERATINQGATLEGAKRIFTCDANTKSEGNREITCLITGKWSTTNLYCRPYCPDPPIIERSTISRGTNLEGDTRRYTCDINTVTEGKTEIVCQKNRRWSLTNLYCRPNCGEPKLIDRATIDKGKTVEGTVRTYTCITGTVSEGKRTITCDNTGKWTITNLYCRPVCQPPPILKRAILSPGNNLQGTTRTYTCDQHTVTEGKRNITCQLDGTWSSTNLYCRPDCGIPMDIDRAVIDEGPTVEGSRRTYTCDPNTKTEGTPEIICLESGIWSKTDLYCRPICHEPPIIKRATILPGSNLEGATRVYTCDANTVTEGETKISCQINGQWSTTNLYCRPNCGEPEIIERATIDKGKTVEGTIRTYTCLSGTVTEGSTKIRCENDGQWSYTDLYCRPVCKPPPIIRRSTISLGNNLQGTTRIYTCAQNTVTEGNTAITCQMDGTWTKTNLYCRPDCGPPKIILRSTIDVGSTLEGSVRTYTCNKNTNTEGITKVTCGEDGKWTLTNLYCRPDCGQPGLIPRATITTGGTLEGDRRRYTCLKNTVTEGNTEIVCQQNGIWTATNLYCRPDCLPPPKIPRATLDIGQTVEGSTRTYTCKSRTVTEGITTIICQKDGQWSSTNLYCRPDCGKPINIERATILPGGTLEGTTRTYKCIQGTVTEGKTEITCQLNGIWSLTNLYCRPDCGIPMNIERATITPGNTLEGTTRIYKCAKNTVTEGETNSLCQINGKWSVTDNDLYCRPDCGEPPLIMRATVTKGTTLEGDIRFYTCSSTSVAEGKREIMCLKSGHWSKTDLYCRPNCGKPKGIARGTIQFNSTLEGSTATYKCFPRNILEGKSTITCQENGRWSYGEVYCRPDCGEPMTIPRSTISHGGTLEGDRRSYTCDIKTVMEDGPNEIVCQKNGKWSATDLFCRPDCGHPKSIQRATISHGNNLYETIRRYTCNEKTLTEGIIDIRCQENGQWTTTNLYCRPDCGIPKLIERASLSYNYTAEGGVAEYKCRPKTVTEGKTIIVCQNDGMWSATDLYCRPDCGPPPKKPNSKIEKCGSTEGSSCMYVCDKNTVTEGITTTKCQLDGTWTKASVYCRPDCGMPVSVENSLIAIPGSTLEGSRLTLRCKKGYVPEGNPTVFCTKEGIWTKPKLYCRPDCGPPTIPPRAYALVKSTLEGAVVEFTCEENTVLEGGNSITCRRDGTWSETNLYCRPDCGPPKKIARARIVPGSTLEGSVIAYVCDENTVSEGTLTITCGSTGYWSETNLYCRPDCKAPKMIHRATISPGPTVEGSVRTYTCAANTVPEGLTSLKCQADGTWTHTDLYCRPDCDEPAEELRAVIDKGSTLYGAVRYYTCVGHSVMEGPNNITCQEDGEWTDSSFYCRPDCGIPMDILRATIDVTHSGTLEGAEATYICDKHTVLEGFPDTMCLSDGTWSEVNIYCRPDCEDPPLVLRSTLRPGPTTEGSIRKYVCDKNTVTEGISETTCQTDGTWTATNLFCRPDCGTPPTFENAYIVAPGSTTFGSEVVYNCVENTVLEGESSIFCLENGNWTKPSLYCRPNCGPPPLPPRCLPIPETTSTLEGSVVLFTCEKNTVGEGDNSIKCGPDGRWTDSDWYCRPDCGEPPSYPRTTIIADDDDTLEGAVVRYICDENTEATGTSTSVCQKDGTWSLVDIKCIPNCGRPSEIARAVLREGSNLAGSIRKYDCIVGTVAEGDNSIRCGDNGLWSRSNLYCRPNCGKPRTILRATISDGDTLEGTTRTYTCDRKSRQEGENTITCKKDGTWTSINLYCRPDCGQPPPVLRATIKPGETNEGSKRRYVCNSDTKAIGDPTIVCKNDGQWTVAKLTCKIKEIVKPPKEVLPPIHDVCDNCDMRNGVGFNPHPEACDQFVQCYFGANNQLRATYRQCPFGLYWDQNALTCKRSKDVACVKETCRIPGLVSYPMSSKIGSCRAYWKCLLGKSYSMCCPEGQRYKANYGCIHDPSCKDACPPVERGKGPCDSRLIFNDPNHFEQYVGGAGWIKMPCAPGTHYNPVDCGCTFHTSYDPGKRVCKPELYLPFDKDFKDYSGNGLHVENLNVSLVQGLAYFNGDAELIIPRFSNFEYGDLVVAFNFLESPPSKGPTALITNSDCCVSTPTMGIVKTYRKLHYLAKCDGGKVTTFQLPLHVGNWNKVYYIHDKKKLEGRCNGIEHKRWAVGQIQRTHTAIHIGYGRNFKNFRGYMDDVAIFLCRPSYL